MNMSTSDLPVDYARASFAATNVNLDLVDTRMAIPMYIQ